MMVLEDRGRLRRLIVPLAFLSGVAFVSACAEIEVGAEAAKRIGRAAGGSGVAAATVTDAGQASQLADGTQLAQASTSTGQPLPISPFLRPAPDIFEATGLAIWDGKRTLQGVWVAHPLAASARRVRIFNQDNGQAVDGALFKRDAAGGGASVLISSEAAQLLGMDVGTPAELRIVAVSPIQRSTEPAVPTGQTAAATAQTTTGSAAGSTTPIPQTGAAATSTQTTQEDTPEQTVPAFRTPKPKPADLKPVEDPAPKVEPAKPEPAKVAAVEPAKPAATKATSPLRLPFVQAGIFGDPGNARRLIRRIEKKNLPALGREIRLKGKKATKVLAGPFQTTSERNAALRTIRAMGLKDAAPVRR